MILHATERPLLNQLEKHIISSTLGEDRVIAFPSDTVYGLGVNGLSKKAVAKLYSVKGREDHKPLILLVDKAEKAFKYILHKNEFDHPLLKEHMPGALTCVFRCHQDIPLYFSTYPSDSLGIRIPDHELLLDLLSSLPFPLVTTSANKSGQPPFETALAIKEYFADFPEDCHPLIIDQGKISGLASTVIQINESEISVIRKGSVEI